MEQITNENYAGFIANEDLSLIKIGASWCGPCRMVAPILERVNNELTDVNIAEIDAEEQPELSRELSVRNIPTTIFYKNGEEVYRHTGAFSEAQLKTLISEHK